MNADPGWMQAAQQLQKNLQGNFEKAMAAFLPGQVPAAPSLLAQAVPNPQAMAGVHIDPAKLLEIQQDYVREASALWNATLTLGAKAAPVTDRRFASEAWNANPMSHFAAATYLLNAKALSALAQAVEGDDKTRASLLYLAVYNEKEGCLQTNSAIV